MNSVTIECKDITKNFDPTNFENATLRGITMTTYSNETIMLMGPSGSGKTTLISIIGGIMTPTSGECLVLGKSINNLPPYEETAFRGKNVGFMFQSFNLVPTLNATENAAIPLLLNGYGRHEALEKATDLLIRLGLENQLEHMPQQLSGGEQQRVSIARGCIHEPKIILCDEPTSFLDSQRGRQIMEILRDIREKTHCTLIIVTHDHRILDFADRILEIEDGVLITKEVPV